MRLHVHVGSVFWENPKTDSRSEIVWLLRSLPKKTEDPKGSFTMRMGCPCAPRDEKNRGKNNKLILAPTARKKRNINYVRINIQTVYILV